MKNYFISYLLLAFLFSCQSQPTEIMDLAGEWGFRLDPEDKGMTEKWYSSTLPDKILLPGSLQEQGYGFNPSLETQWTGQIIDTTWHRSPLYSRYTQPENFKVPFWLTPDKHYVGAAWYQREINIPSSDAAQTFLLELERPHWETTVFMDGIEIGKENSLSVPHRYILDNLTAGKHTLTIRVDNSIIIPVGENAHSVSDISKIQISPF